MSIKQLSAGDTIESHCTKCRTIMNHTIVAMVNGQPGRVECNTCKGIHNYRKPAEAKTTTRKPAAPRKKAAARTDPDLAAWTDIDFSSATVIPYSMQASFQLDDIVKHPSFGLGKVVQLIPPNKVEILFQDGRKLLRCA